MSEIVKNEMDAIAAFAEDTEKRRSTLTLNELNYISDKQLHKKDGGGSGPVEWDFLAEMVPSVSVSGSEINLLAGDFQTYYNKFSSGSAVSTNGMLYDLSGMPVLCKITATIMPFGISEDGIQFKIMPIKSPDPNQFWTLNWSPDNSLELDTTPVA